MGSPGLLTWTLPAPVMRRVSRWSVGLSVAVVLAAVVFVVLRETLGGGRAGWFKWIPLGAGLLPLTVILHTGWWMLRGVRRDWHASSGRLCTHCGYDVSGLAPAGTCPECGNGYDLVKDAPIWGASGLTHRATAR